MATNNGFNSQLPNLTQNSILFIGDNLGTISSNSNFYYNHIFNQFIHCSSVGSITNNFDAAIASNNSAMGADYCMTGASDTCSHTCPYSAMVASSNCSSFPTGDHLFTAAATSVLFNLACFKSAAIGTVSTTFNSGSAQCGTFCANGTLGALFTVMIGTDAGNNTGAYSGIYSGYTNTISGNYSAILAGYQSTVSGSNAVSIGKTASITANGSFLFNDGTSVVSLGQANTACFMTTGGFTVNNITPPSCASFTFDNASGVIKGMRIPTVTDYTLISSPSAPLIVYDSSRDQYMCYKSGDWSVMA